MQSQKPCLLTEVLAVTCNRSSVGMAVAARYMVQLHHDLFPI